MYIGSIINIVYQHCYNLSLELRLQYGKDLKREKGDCISGKA